MVVTFVEHESGEISQYSLEALVLGRQLAAQTGEPLEALMIGASARRFIEPLRSHGVRRLHLLVDERLDIYLPEAWAYAVAGLIASVKPTAAIAAGSERGNELMARVAAIRDEALATNCLRVEANEKFLVVRQRWGGSLLEEAYLDGSVKLITTAPNVFQVATEPATDIEVSEVAPPLPDSVFRVRAIPAPTAESSRISLAEARVVVGGGRGVGSADGFGPLEELAELLDGAVGCSRAVTSNGWRPHAEQIGQTGERITADLYIACGVSGAMQHIVGAKGAKHILAINTDPGATIMDYADYAIIGDLHQVVPAIIAELKRVKSS